MHRWLWVSRNWHSSTVISLFDVSVLMKMSRFIDDLIREDIIIGKRNFGIVLLLDIIEAEFSLE